MKPAATLKELLKPPFYHSACGQIHEGNTRIMEAPGYVCKNDNITDSHVAKIRGWGFFQYFENGEELQDEFIEFVVQALNEKWERDFGEPKRWVLDSDYAGRESIICPYCRTEYCFDELPDWENYSHCPSCAQRLLPPEEAKNV